VSMALPHSNEPAATPHRCQPWTRPRRWLALLCLLTSATSATAFAVPIERWETSNGLSVHFVRTETLPLLDLIITFDAGSARDGELPGLASVTSALLDQGAAGLDADTIAQRFDDQGARFSASSSRDQTQLQMRSLNAPQTLGRTIHTLTQVLAQPDFPDDALERTRARMLIGLQQAERSPAAVAEQRLWEALYPGHPYASPPAGTVEGLRQVTREDLLGFHQRHYTRRNAVLTLVGDISRIEAEQIARTIAEALPPGTPAEPLPPAPPTEGPATVRVAMPGTQTVVLRGQVGHARGDARHFELLVANHIVGGSGLASRLGVAMREERGLSYGVSSSFSPMRVAGPFVIRTQVRNDRVDEALAVLDAEFADIAKRGFGDAEFEDAIHNISGGFPLSLDSNAGIASLVAMVAFHRLPDDYLRVFTTRVMAVDRESATKSWLGLIDADRMVTVLVGPEPAP
jgi:zinc protease